MKIIYEDRHLIVLDKPAGLSVLPDGWEKDSDYLVKRLEKQYEEVLIVHRLDKITSGVMIFARDAETHRALNIQFENRTGIVQVPVLNVRTGPGTKFPIVGKLKENDTVSIFESDGNWDRIGEKQWVSADFIELTE